MEIKVQKEYWVSGNERTAFNTVEQYGREAVPRIARHVNGRIDVMGFWYTQRRGLGEQRLRITPPRSGHVYDLQTNAYLGRQSSFEVTKPLEGSGFYVVTPYRIETPKVKVQAAKAKGGNTQIQCRVSISPQAAASERHVVRMQLFAPDGREWRDFSQCRVAEKGGFTHVFTLPLNAPPGVWRVCAREAISGLSDQVTVEWP